MIDAIVIVILLIFAGVGYRRGLIRSAVTLLSSVGALILSFIIYPAINTFLKVTPIYTHLYEKTLERLQGIDFGKGLQSQGETIMSEINWLPQLLTQQVKDNNNAVMYKLLGTETLTEYVAVYITQLIIALLAILVTWVIIKIMLTGGLRTMGGIIERLPVISTFNHGGGLLLGIVKGLLMFSLVGLMIPIFIDQPLFQQLLEGIQGSVLGNWLYENNLIVLIYNRYFCS